MKTIITLVLIAASFYGGMQYDSRVLRNPPISPGEAIKLAIPPSGINLKNVLGEVVSTENSVLVLKGADEALFEVSVLASTTISRNMSLKLADLKPGFKVAARGVLGADGLFAASSLNVVSSETSLTPTSSSTRVSK